MTEILRQSPAATAPLVCLVSPGHVASTPRLVKNADALAAAGYRVHVVAGRHFPPADPFDAQIFAGAQWSHSTVDWVGGGIGSLGRKLQRRLARELVRRGRFARRRLAAIAHHAEAWRLAAAAAAVPAAFYFGHCLAGLPAAAFAARARGVRYGFDAEDYHDAETAGLAADPAELVARQTLQAELLPACALFTAAAPLISRQYEQTYGVRPVTVLNVFPLSQAPSAPAVPGAITAERPARLYWFSQTIGPGRGLEAAIAMLGHLRTPAELHLRGFVADDYRARLESLAAGAGRNRAIRFLAPGPPAEMVRLAADADLGLSLEENHPLNRDLCLTNKIFVYLLAGVPQLLSDTTAQTAIASELGAAALAVRPADSAETARRVDAFLGDRTGVAAARRSAWDLARRRFNWDCEQEKLLAGMRRILP